MQVYVRGSMEQVELLEKIYIGLDNTPTNKQYILYIYQVMISGIDHFQLTAK